jgi:predicted acyl esterase
LQTKAAKKSPGPPSDGDFFQRRQARAEHLAQLRHLYPIPGPIPEAVTETSGVIEARDGYQIPIKTYRPVSKPAKPSPVIIMM